MFVILFFGKIWMEPAVFALEFRQRLGVVDTSMEVWYSYYNLILDIFFFFFSIIIYYIGIKYIVRYYVLRDIFVIWLDRTGL